MENESFLDLDLWNDVIIADRHFFLEYSDELNRWATDMDRIYPVTHKLKK